MMSNAQPLIQPFRVHQFEKYEGFVRGKRGPQIPFEKAGAFEKVYFEVGAGSGHFFSEMAKIEGNTLFIAVERDRMRGNALVNKAKRLSLPNFVGLRGNIIPAFLNDIPDNFIDCLFILYPCPWPKNAHRKNRWHFHPVMKHFVRTLKKGGTLVWASDQKFYIDEVEKVSQKFYQLECLKFGPVSPCPENFLSPFPTGRTKFEQDFLTSGQPCYELISRKR